MSTICSTCCWIKWCTTKLHMNSCQQTSACLLVSAQTLSIQTGRRQSRVWPAGSVQHDRLHIRSRPLNNHTWLIHISIFEATILLEAIFYMNSSRLRLDLRPPSTGKMFVWSPAFLPEPGWTRYSSAPSITTVWSSYHKKSIKQCTTTGNVSLVPVAAESLHKTLKEIWYGSRWRHMMAE